MDSTFQVNVVHIPLLIDKSLTERTYFTILLFIISIKNVYFSQ